MTIEEVSKLLPKQFRIAAQTIKVEVTEYEEYFGVFEIWTNVIKINTCTIIDGKVHYLDWEQIRNTFYHELIHCFNYFYNTETDEALAQSFANFICEYLDTKINGTA